MRTRFLVAALSVTSVISAQIPPSSREQALGRLLAQDVESRERILDDVQINTYLSALTHKLEPFCSSQPVEVRVSQSEDVNASSVIGGHLYITSAMLRFAVNESEIVGVLAHLMKREPLIKGGNDAPTVILNDRNGDHFLPTPDSLVPRGLQSTVEASAEKADTEAMQCMEHAGYDPTGMILLLQRLPSATLERMEGVAQTIVGLEPSNAYVVTTSAFVEMQRRLDALLPARRASASTLYK